MSTLENQYKQYTKDNPNSIYSFEGWKIHVLGKMLSSAVEQIKIIENNKIRYEVYKDKSDNYWLVSVNSIRYIEMIKCKDKMCEGFY